MNKKGTEYLQKVYESLETNLFLQKSLKTFHAAYFEVLKLELKKRGLLNEAVNEKHINQTLDRIAGRMDMAEFGIPSLVRILKAYSQDISEELYLKIKHTLIGFRYWLDEPGDINACYFTENHQPLYHSAEYLIGSIFPDDIFPSNGRSGKWHREHGKKMLEQWMFWRKRFGFSEWNTNYYAEDMIALLGVVNYGDDDKIKKEAKTIIDMIFLELGLNTFEGHWIGSQGRTYVEYIFDNRTESISPICWMYWGKGTIETPLADCAIMLAVYDYPCPEEAVKAACYDGTYFENKERMSLNTCDAKMYGVDPSDPDNIMFFWGNQTYSAKSVIDNSMNVIIKTNWMNERFIAYKEKYKLHEMAGVPCDEDPDFTALTQADIYTYRTKDYGLCCAQNFRKGKRGYQQQPWGAYLGGNAKVFSTNPGSSDYEDRPNLIAGNMILPKAVQYKNVLLSIHRIPADFTRYLETHLYFPVKEFDEVIQKKEWIFGRRKDGYIAVRSLMPAYWEAVDERAYKTVYGEDFEKYVDERPFFYKAHGHANVWVVEMGNKTDNGSFCNFTDLICSKARIEGDTFYFRYMSPTIGNVECGWEKPFMVEGKEIAINDYNRYDNIFKKVEWPEPCDWI